MNASFTLFDAEAAVPYLSALGVSHLYLSPIFAAVPGSTHGYDVVDHSLINPELGGIAGLYALDTALRAHDMGLILDIVPNHVGVAGGSNEWWRDTLRFGSQSDYASYFDIDWAGQPQLTSGVVVVPVLGQPFGVVMEAGELALAYEAGEIAVRYQNRTFPLAPSTYSAATGLPPSDLAARLRDADSLGAFVRILEELKSADPPTARSGMRRLERLLEQEPLLRAFLDARLAERSGRAGDPHSFDALETILRQQHYRLAYWRVSGEEINYRRFFDINDLAAIRIEHQPVFDASHALLKELADQHMLAGVRVDHVDGLYAPGEYLQRLDALLNAARPEGPRCRIWVEKILAPDEKLEPWPVAGATGYEFIAVAGGLVVDPQAEQSMTRTYNDFVGEARSYEEVAFSARRWIAEHSFAGEVTVLSLQLHRLAQDHRRYRDITLNGHRDAILALLATFPVYRTYDDGIDGPDASEELIQSAANEALRRDRDVSVEAIDFLVEVLCLRTPAGKDAMRALWAHFRRRFQQISAPIMAKGVEDTSFYRYPRLLALNEVGCSPARFGIGFDSAHAWFLRRAEEWPESLSASSTHDTKRSEDARARLAALSEMPHRWQTQVRAFARQNAKWKRAVDGAAVPDRQAEYYLYQTLVSIWEGNPSPDFAQRVTEHMTKALREAKYNTSWVRVNERYEAAVAAFVGDLLNPRKSARFLSRLDQLVAQVTPGAAANSLAQLALKCIAPGIPDFYQGSERTIRQLTDPDNRGAVDFRGSAPHSGPPLRELPAPVDTAAKPWLTARLLQLRAALPDLFAAESYRPVALEGDMAGHAFGFMRQRGAQRVLVLVLLRSASVLDSCGRLLPGSFGPSNLTLPGTGGWRNWLTGEPLPAGMPIDPAALLASFPVAVVVSE